MLGPRHEHASLQSDFYRDQFRRALRLLFFAMAIIFILIGVIIYQLLVQAPTRYFANTTEGRIIPMPTPIALSQQK